MYCGKASEHVLAKTKESDNEINNSIVGFFGKGKVKSVLMSQVAHHVGAYSGFNSMKWLRVFLLPPGWDASPL